MRMILDLLLFLVELLMGLLELLFRAVELMADLLEVAVEMVVSLFGATVRLKRLRIPRPTAKKG